MMSTRGKKILQLALNQNEKEPTNPSPAKNHGNLPVIETKKTFLEEQKKSCLMTVI